MYCAAVKAKNVVTIEVDGVMAAPGFGVEGVSHTNTQDPLYIGGVPGNSFIRSFIHSKLMHTIPSYIG